MPLCGNPYQGNTLRALAGDVTLRWETMSFANWSRETGDLILVKIKDTALNLFRFARAARESG